MKRIQRIAAAMLAVLLFVGDPTAFIPAYAATTGSGSSNHQSGSNAFSFFTSNALRAGVSTATGGTNVVLSFPNSSDPQASSIVSGGGVKLNVSKPSGYVEKDDSANGLQMMWKNYQVLQGKGIEISGDAVKTINVLDNFFTVNQDVFNGNDPINLAISGAYTAILGSGTFGERGVEYKPGVADPEILPETYGDFTISPSQVVYKTSSFTLECSRTENSNQAPGFNITAKSELFSGYDAASVKRRTADNQPLQVTLIDSTGKLASCTVTFTPDTPYFTGEDGNKLTDASGKFITNKYIQKGATFTFTLQEATSNAPILTIWSPEAAAKKIKTDIENKNGQPGEQDFIKLASGDTLTFISKDFQVEYSLKQFNTDFYLKWKWVPDDPRKQDVVQFVDRPNGTQTVTVNPEYNDVKGKFEIGICCRKAVDDTDIVETAVLSPVVIKGTGLPGSLERESQWMTIEDPGTGKRIVTEQNFDVDPGDDKDTEMPQTIRLNAYNGTVPGTEIPKDPSKYKIKLNMGLDNGASVYAKAECVGGDKSIITMQTEDPKLRDYAFGGEITNTRKDTLGTEGTAFLIFNPVKTGKRTDQSARIKVTFYILDGSKNPVETYSETFTVVVVDDSPSSDATLKSLILKGRTSNNGTEFWSQVDYGFDAKNTDYTFEVDYKYDALQLTPTKNDSFGSREIKIKAMYADGTYADGWGDPNDVTNKNYYKTVQSASVSDAIPIKANSLLQLEVVVTAEDTTTRTYRLNILRKPQGTDSTLKSLTLTDTDGKVLFNGIKPNQFVYDITIPFKVQKVKVDYQLNDPNAPKLDPEVSFNPILEQNGQFSEKVWLDIIKGVEGSPGSRSMTFTVKTLAEDGRTNSTYIINVKRADPSQINTLKELSVLDATNSDKALTYTPKFHADMVEGDYYELSVPFNISKLKISAKANDTGATIILLGEGLDGTGQFGDNENGGEGWLKISSSTPSKAFTPPPFIEGQEDSSYYLAMVEVWPESTPPPATAERPKPGDPDYANYMTKVMRYPIHIFRSPASTDATLKSIKLADQENKAIEFLDFDPDVTDYTIQVPYEVSKISVTPTANDPFYNRILVAGKKIASGQPSTLLKLEEKNTEILVEVFPEDVNAPSKVYKLTIVRSDPSSDARLVKLEVSDASPLVPVFAPSQLQYSAKVAEGAEGVKVTATANNPGAKITIDGKRVESGKQSELIRILTIEQTITIDVIAQDGKTPLKYEIKLTNENLIEKTSNADLKALSVSPGSMRPTQFKPSVTTYEVAVTEETYDVEILPVPADPLATMKVFYDSKEIGDNSNHYGAFIQDGENEFTVEVTSPDETKTKTYSLMVYRNEDGKMGDLDPLEPEDIDFKNGPDVIVVDITKYSRVAATVFEELKKYPEKKIIFQGNDYSLQFNAKDISKIVPNVPYYDLGMRFSSPLEGEIMSEINSHEGNGDVEVVFIYFEYHGDLPGPTTLTLSLGQKYKNKTLFWNYYNEERERIDYYGFVKTNTKGTFSVKLNHMSTYLATNMLLVGAENKSGSGSSGGGNISAGDDKLLPDTGKEAVDEKTTDNPARSGNGGRGGVSGISRDQWNAQPQNLGGSGTNRRRYWFFRHHI